MKILVIEDEPKAAEYLRQGLAESGYAVEVALNGTDGLHAAANGDHDLVVLDVMLPGIDGFAVLSALRTSKQTPVLMLTARGKTDDKLRGFDLGADDYLVKPFQFPELLARVRALLKRGQPGAADPSLKVGDLEIDPVRHRTAVKTEPVDLALEARKVTDYLSLVAEERALQLQVVGTAPPISADRLLVQRAITNLVSNAIRHASRQSEISIQIASTDHRATLSVTNKGEGIAPEHIERIFERFYRADPGRARGEGGSGLGLAIVRSIATLHDGKVEVVSVNGRTTFTLSFPTAGVRLPA